MNLLIKINLIGNDEKDYFISPSFFNYSINIDNKKIINLLKGKFFGFSTWSSKYFSGLNLANEKKTSLFYFFDKRLKAIIIIYLSKNSNFINLIFLKTKIIKNSIYQN